MELAAEGMKARATKPIIAQIQYTGASAAGADRATSPMDVQIKAVEPLPGYRLRLGLSDGRTVERDLSHLLPGPDAHPDDVFRPWLDPAYFARVVLPADPWPAPTWPNGVDLDPDVLIWGVDADGHLLKPEHAEEHA